MEQLELITCILQRGKAAKVVKSAIKSGAQGATTFYARGTGVRRKLGLIGAFIQPEKEVIMIVTRLDETENVFQWSGKPQLQHFYKKMPKMHRFRVDSPHVEIFADDDLREELYEMYKELKEMRKELKERKK